MADVKVGDKVRVSYEGVVVSLAEEGKNYPANRMWVYRTPDGADNGYRQAVDRDEDIEVVDDRGDVTIDDLNYLEELVGYIGYVVKHGNGIHNLARLLQTHGMKAKTVVQGRDAQRLANVEREKMSRE